MIGFIADQLPKLENMNHWTHFPNHETSFLSGQNGLPNRWTLLFYYVDVERVKRGYYRATFRLMTLHPKEYADYD